jgi:hypothetical protein
VCEEYWRAIRGRPELVYVTSFVAESSYPEFRITGFIPTFRLSRLGGLTALFSLLLCGSGWSGGRDNREGVEEREERVGGLVAAGWGADRGGLSRTGFHGASAKPGLAQTPETYLHPNPERAVSA